MNSITSDKLIVADAAPVGVLTPITVQQVAANVRYLHELVRKVMQEGLDADFGVIPGTKKKTLFLAGAEKLMNAFGLWADTSTEMVELTEEPGHREYRAKCILRNSFGNTVGGADATCSTMESKYRYTGGMKKPTDQPIPREYWNLKKAGQLAEAQRLIGGPGYAPGKDDSGAWVVCELGEKEERKDLADVYPTCQAIAEKRAIVRAVRRRTGASSLFVAEAENTYEEEQIHQQPAPTAQEAAPTGPVEPTDHGECLIIDVTQVDSPKSSKSKWTGYWVTAEKVDGSQVRAWTWNEKDFQTAGAAKESGARVLLKTRPSKKPGTVEVAGITPVAEADIIP